MSAALVRKLRIFPLVRVTWSIFEGNQETSGWCWEWSSARADVSGGRTWKCLHPSRLEQCPLPSARHPVLAACSKMSTVIFYVYLKPLIYEYTMILQENNSLIWLPYCTDIFQKTLNENIDFIHTVLNGLVRISSNYRIKHCWDSVQILLLVSTSPKP